MSDKPTQTLEGCGKVWRTYETVDYAIYDAETMRPVSGHTNLSRLRQHQEKLAELIDASERFLPCPEDDPMAEQSHLGVALAEAKRVLQREGDPA